MDLFRVRLNCIDNYQATPTEFDPVFRSHVSPSQISKEPNVPVIRVFGATETGQKVCAHIHGAFPYLYIEYEGSLDPDDGELCSEEMYIAMTNETSVDPYIHRLHLSIDYALAVSYRRNAYDGKALYVAKIVIVKGVPFYGFHVGYKFYLKIYMLNPMVITRLADLLRQGVVMKKVFQPYEAHLQYLLQWMTDYNLYGCGYINCSRVIFRNPVPNYEEVEHLSHVWHDRSIPGELLRDESILPRVSHCSLEVDICVQDILNRKDAKPRPLHHDFIELLNPPAADGKLVHSMAGLWRDETRRRKLRMSDPDPESSPFPAEVLISMSADSRNTQPGGWIHEEEYREKVLGLIRDEKSRGDGAEVSFSTFVKPAAFESSVETSLEGIGNINGENLRPALRLTPGRGMGEANYNLVNREETEVDENQILGLGLIDDDEFPFDSDEEVMHEMGLSQKHLEVNIQDQHSASEETMQLGHVADDESHASGENNAAHNFPSSDLNLLNNTTSSSENGTGSIYPFEMQHPRLGVPNSEYALISSMTRRLPHEHTTIEAPVESFGRGSKRSESSVKVANVDNKRQRVSFGQIRETGPSIPDLKLQGTTHILHQNRPEEGGSSSFAADLKGAEGHGRAKPRPRTVNGASIMATSSVIKTFSQESPRMNERAQTQPIKFPVVKDPQDPSTILRLSQKSSAELSLSDKKHVAFGISLPFSHSPTKPMAVLNSDPPFSVMETASDLSKVIKNMKDSFGVPGHEKILGLSEPSPSSVEVISTMHNFGLPEVIYQDAFYSNEADVPERARDWAGREFKLGSTTVPFLPEFDPTGTSDATFGEKQSMIPDKMKEEKVYERRRRTCRLKSWEIAEPPPTYQEVDEWYHKEAHKLATTTKSPIPSKSRRTKVELSQIDCPTQKNKHGFKYTQNQATTSVKHEVQYMSTMSLEIHVNTRGKLMPNPEEDEVQCLFWCLRSDEQGLRNSGILEGTTAGIVALSEDGTKADMISRQASVELHAETSELDLMIRMVEIVRSHDPDILTGYEVHGGSWGYLIERARLKYDYDLCDEFSRMKAQSHGRFGKENDKWGFNNTSTIRVTGRHMINIWRAMRSELNLLQYTMENVAFHLLRRRIPHFSFTDLTRWYTSGKPADLAKVINYYISRVQVDLEILEENELIPRTSEQARLLGVDFFSVFSRGSQFKVESLMFRIAKLENFLLISPSRKQVGGQNALECLPLVMEPQSAFYTSPVLVLDFQSLYPSVMIAYNYCYSTFLGRIVDWRGTNKMGCTEFKRQQGLLELLKDHINIAPNGMMYAKPEIRKSLLAKMLSEILETRVMVKSGMKVDKDDITLQRLLNNRQLALKLIANVTYGYTSASFSGRMPCSEIADSIVQTARETLEKSIALIHSVKRWGAEVVYGDTDSLFIHLKGRTKDQAFDIGEEIAKTITNVNPRPVKLKFEKVYFPCVLLAKKRYVGFKYEHRNQVEPEFDAKGIETVRRDGTPAEQKMEETALKILFRTSDLSQVKSYFQKQCEKIMKGSVSVQDFCFAREVKLGSYSEKGPPPPGALISTKKMLEDARAEPQYGERVPYVVITGAPGARLIDRCVAPDEVLENDHIELDADYYISKNLIPPLERIFNLTGANVRQWYDEMPKVQRIRRVDANLQLRENWTEASIVKKTLESYMKSSSCLVCREKLESDASPICPSCVTDKATSLLSLRTRMHNAESKFLDIQKICQSCSGISPLDEVKCDSKDCPAFYSRAKQKTRLKMEKAIIEPAMKELSERMVDVGDIDW